MTKKRNQEVAIDISKIGGETSMIVNHILDGCLYSGFFGTLDSARIKRVTDEIVEMVETNVSDFLIVDLANVDFVDTAVAAHLIKVADVLKLLGTDVIFCGIRSLIAQSMISAGINLTNQSVSRNLQSAILVVLERQGLQIVKVADAKANRDSNPG